jgi:hypothetical protein
MASKCNQKNDDQVIGRFAFVEIVAGYCLILGVMAIMFFGATGIGLEIPWEVFCGGGSVGGLLAALVLRNRLQKTKCGPEAH